MFKKILVLLMPFILLESSLRVLNMVETRGG